MAVIQAQLVGRTPAQMQLSDIGEFFVNAPVYY